MTKLISGPDTYQGQGFNIISILIGFKQRYGVRSIWNVIFITWNQPAYAKASDASPSERSHPGGPDRIILAGAGKSLLRSYRYPSFGGQATYQPIIIDRRPKSEDGKFNN